MSNEQITKFNSSEISNFDEKKKLKDEITKISRNLGIPDSDIEYLKKLNLKNNKTISTETAELNIDRLDDILKELSSQIRSLNKQSREAKRYKNLSQKIRESEILLLAKNYITFEMVCNENEGKLNSLNVEYHNIVRDISTKKT